MNVIMDGLVLPVTICYVLKIAIRMEYVTMGHVCVIGSLQERVVQHSHVRMGALGMEYVWMGCVIVRKGL